MSGLTPVRADEVTAKRVAVPCPKEKDLSCAPHGSREAVARLQSSVSRLVLAHEPRHRKPRASTLIVGQNEKNHAQNHGSHVCFH